MAAVQFSFIVHLLTLFSLLNAAYTFYRKRHYRLFETSVEDVPSTPSAHRVRVDSSPLSSSPLRFLSNVLASTNAEARAHPDATKDVWEIAVWDPLPICLRLFCTFSPGHVLVYWLFLPTLHSDPRPSTTIATTMFLTLLLTLQLSFLHTSFSQQSKDSALIHKEVLHEYDTKFVHPRMQHQSRDVGTQYFSTATQSAAKEEKYNTVDTYTPMTIINKGFKPNPNPNYTSHVDPDGANLHSFSRASSTQPSGMYTPARQRDASTPVRLTAIRQPQFRPPATASDGGSLGVYSHAHSPLRKSASADFRERSVAREGNRRVTTGVGDGDRELMSRGPAPVRSGSPLKNSSTPGGLNGHPRDGRRRETGRW